MKKSEAIKKIQAKLSDLFCHYPETWDPYGNRLTKEPEELLSFLEDEIGMLPPHDEGDSAYDPTEWDPE